MLVLIGPSGSGKSTVEKKLREYGFRPTISHTTRSPRDGEVNGKTYFFVSKEEFLKLDEGGYFAESLEYNGNFYAISKEQCVDDAVIVVAPEGLEQLLEKDDLNIISCYLDVNEDLCYERMVNSPTRQDTKESAIERIQNDRIIFNGVKRKCMFIIDGSGTVDKVVDEILEKIQGLTNK